MACTERTMLGIYSDTEMEKLKHSSWCKLELLLAIILLMMMMMMIDDDDIFFLFFYASSLSFSYTPL